MEQIAPGKPSALHVLASSLFPFIFGLYPAAMMTLVMAHGNGTEAVPVVLVAWCALLGFSGFWLNRAVFRSTRTLVPFVTATLVILLVWLWQRQAFALLVPNQRLTYGFFETPEGAKAGFWVLTCPFWIGSVALTICLIMVLIFGWRTGRRALLMCVIPWWLAAFLIFALPSMYLDAQGNASIFI